MKFKIEIPDGETYEVELKSLAEAEIWAEGALHGAVFDYEREDVRSGIKINEVRCRYVAVVCNSHNGSLTYTYDNKADADRQAARHENAQVIKFEF